MPVIVGLILLGVNFPVYCVIGRLLFGGTDAFADAIDRWKQWDWEVADGDYAGWGLQTPRVPWGIHPELLAVPIERAGDGLVRFVFPGGFLGHRKPAEPVIEAFRDARRPTEKA